jgi:hypothetical protein
MTVLSVSGVGQSPYQIILQITGQQSSPAAAGDQSAAQAPAGEGHHHHRGGGAIANLLNAITNALNSADPAADPNQVIQDAITKLVSGQGGTTSNANGAGTDADGDNDGSTVSSVQPSAQQGGASSALQSFIQALQAHGVSFQQFRSDLLAAIKNAQNGQVNPGTALQSFPPGAALDASA